MTTGQVRTSKIATRRAKLPGLRVPAGLAPEQEAFFSAVKERLEVREGERSNPFERAVTVRDLQDLERKMVVYVSDKTSEATKPSGTDGGSDSTTPRTPDDFARIITDLPLFADLVSQIQGVQEHADNIFSRLARRLGDESGNIKDLARRINDEQMARAQGFADEVRLRNQTIARETAYRRLALSNEARQRIATTEDNAQSILRSALATHKEILQRRGTMAIARQELTTKIEDGLSAEATARLTLAAQVDDQAATLITVQTTQATQYEALSSSITALTATVEDNAAAITAEETARATAVSAEATQRNLLAAQLRGSYTGTDPTLLASGLLYQERIARVAAEESLANQIVLLSAGTGEQFDWAKIYYFDSGVEGWTGNGTPTVSQSFIRPANDGSDPYIVSPTGLAVAGDTYKQVRLRIKKTGSPTWEGYLWWRGTADSTWDSARRVSLAEPSFDGDGIAVITFNSTWTGTVDRIRLDLSTGQDASHYFEVDWVALGRPSPGASAAQVLAEQTARTTAILAEASSREALSVLLVGEEDPTGLTLSTLASGLLYDERELRVTADEAMASDITLLQADMTTAQADILSEASTRATAISSEATSRQTLSTVVTGVADPTGLNLAALSAGLIHEEKTARTTADGTLATSISTLSASTTSALGTLTADLATESTARTTGDAALASQITTLATGARKLSKDDEAAAYDIIRNALAGQKEAKARRNDFAVLRTELTTTFTAGLEAEAAARLLLGVSLDENTAALESESLTRATADTALASSITTLTATVGSNAALVATQITALSDEQSAQAESITALLAQTDDNTAAILTEQTARTTADSALASSITSLAATVATAEAAITSEATTRATADSALASSITTLTAVVDDGFAAAEDSITVVADRATGLEAQRVIKVATNGAMAGIGLASTTDSEGNSTSAILMMAHKFALVQPTDTFIDPNNPSTSRIPFGIDSDGTIYMKGLVRIDASGRPLGKGGVRQFYVAGSSWNDTIANGAVASETGMGAKLVGDQVTITNASSFAETRYWNGAAWTNPGVVVSGSMIVTGGIGTSNLAATAVTADKMAANSITAANGAIADLAVSTLKIQGEAVTIPRAASGTYSATVTVPVPYDAHFHIVATFTQGEDRDGSPVNMAVDGAVVITELPIARTTGAMGKVVYLTAGTHTISIYASSYTGSMACSLLVLGCLR